MFDDNDVDEGDDNDVDEGVDVLFNDISVISGGWEGIFQRLYGIELRLRLKRYRTPFTVETISFPHPAGY